MTAALIIFLLLLNLAISCWNGFAAGALWEEAKATGGWFKLVVICAAIMSACGFFQLNLIVLGFAAVWADFLEPKYLELVLKIGYLFLVPTVIGTGLIIWLDSLAQAWRQRDILSGGVAAWNTYAMYSNVRDAMEHTPQIAGDVASGIGDLFSGEDGPKVAVLAVIVAIISLSVVLSILMVRYFWKWGRQVRQRTIGDYVREHQPARA